VKRVVGDPTVAIAYLRVSTEDQAVGPKAQRDAIEAWGRARGVRVVAWRLDQGVSGGTDIEDRPALLDALADVGEHRAGLLVVARRDRLARDVILAAMIERMAATRGASVVSAAGEGEGTGPEALLMRRMVDAFAEYERALIRARTVAALRAKAARGERVGGLPIGATVAGKMLVPDPDETRAVDEIRRLRAGGLSLRKIARWLNENGHAPRGERWHKTTVERTVRRLEQGRIAFQAVPPDRPIEGVGGVDLAPNIASERGDDLTG
jgi:DNA invertase Pin-like site-specific DNA recombinase